MKVSNSFNSNVGTLQFSYLLFLFFLQKFHQNPLWRWYFTTRFFQIREFIYVKCLKTLQNSKVLKKRQSCMCDVYNSHHYCFTMSRAYVTVLRIRMPSSRRDSFSLRVPCLFSRTWKSFQTYLRLEVSFLWGGKYICRRDVQMHECLPKRRSVARFTLPKS